MCTTDVCVCVCVTFKAPDVVIPQGCMYSSFFFVQPIIYSAHILLLFNAQPHSTVLTSFFVFVVVVVSELTCTHFKLYNSHSSDVITAD